MLDDVSFHRRNANIERGRRIFFLLAIPESTWPRQVPGRVVIVLQSVLRALSSAPMRSLTESWLDPIRDAIQPIFRKPEDEMPSVILGNNFPPCNILKQAMLSARNNE